MKREIDAILRRVDRLPVLDSRTADEILGYDEDGLPQSEAPNAQCPSASKPGLRRNRNGPLEM